MSVGATSGLRRLAGAGCVSWARTCTPGPSRRYISTAEDVGSEEGVPLSTLRNALLAESGERTATSRRVACYVRAVRKHQNVTFLSISDGSLTDGTAAIQAVLRKDLKAEYDSKLSPGVSLELVGLVKASRSKQQAVEFSVEKVLLTGTSESSSYPIRLADASSEQPTPPIAQEGHAERMRRYAHLRPRDIRHAAVLRARDTVERAISNHFHARDFVRVAAPILTSSDCEGGGEVFEVQAAAGGSEKKAPISSFWSDTRAYLTVSAQLHLEAIALGLGRVYTVGPSFRAEKSATNRHLAEFWMCEGEQITSNDEARAMDEVTDVVEGVLKSVIEKVLTERVEISRYLWQGKEEDRQRLLDMGQVKRWRRLTYTEAIQELQSASLSKEAPKWGDALASEHERWLARDGPVFVTHYPALQKPFYMRLSRDGKTVACFDLLVPGLGELVGGSLRETRAEVLEDRLPQSGDTATNDKLAWYTDDLRRFGCNPHGGFGIGVERLLSWLTNTDSVRDVVTFPRVKGPLHF